MKRLLIWLPLLIFVGLIGLMIHGLEKPEQRTIASRMVGKPMPQFTLPPAATGVPGLTRADLGTGKPHLVNIFASWCVPCAAEAPQLLALRDAGVPIVGIAIRDARADVDAFLKRNGNPFTRIGLDARSSVQFELGSSGVPESFIVDGKGMIVHQHIGDIRAEQVPDLLAKIRATR